jgi:hypothetical protein
VVEVGESSCSGRERSPDRFDFEVEVNLAMSGSVTDPFDVSWFGARAGPEALEVGTEAIAVDSESTEVKECARSTPCELDTDD